MKWLNQIMAIIIVFTIIFSDHSNSQAEENIEVSAESAIVMDQNSNRILFHKNANQKMRIASITKIMTAILAIESGKLDQYVTVSSRAVHTEGSSIYLQEKQKVKLKDLVYGLMLRSGNDAAVAIAEFVGGSVEGFVFMMNQKAELIGMSNTEFSNPHGLDDHENHYSTAYDMALLTKYAMENKTFKKIFGTKEYHRGGFHWKNKNKLLNLYEYCTGGKTGYTKRAKRTLVSTAAKDGLHLISVTLNAPDDWNDHISMYDHAFGKYENVMVKKEGYLDNIHNSIYQNHIFLNRDVVLPLTKEEMASVTLRLSVIKPKEDWRDHPQKAPAKVGMLNVLIKDKIIEKVPIYFDNGQIEKPNRFLKNFQSIFWKVTGASA